MSDAKQVTQGEIPVCKGRNCYSTTGEHSPECLIEAAEAQGWEDAPVIQAARLFLRLRNEPVLPPPPANPPPRSTTMPGTLDQNGTAAAMRAVPVGWLWKGVPRSAEDDTGRWWPSDQIGSRKWMIPNPTIYTPEILAKGRPILPEEAQAGCMRLETSGPLAGQWLTHDICMEGPFPHPWWGNSFAWLRPHADDPGPILPYQRDAIARGEMEARLAELGKIAMSLHGTIRDANEACFRNRDVDQVKRILENAVNLGWKIRALLSAPTEAGRAE